MIGSERGSSPALIHNKAKTFPVENFEAWMKDDMDANMATLLAGGILHRSSFLGNLKPLDKNLGR